MADRLYRPTSANSNKVMQHNKRASRDTKVTARCMYHALKTHRPVTWIELGLSGGCLQTARNTPSKSSVGYQHIDLASHDWGDVVRK